MLSNIIKFSIHNKLLVGLAVLALMIGGLMALRQLPIDAVPDITNNQVQVVTTSPSLAPQEMEEMVSFPIEMAVRNLPGVEEVRSISRYGLSVVTIVFEEDVPTLQARQLVSEQIRLVGEDFPDGASKPELMPITTGLGEVYQYVLVAKPGYENAYSLLDLRTIQDWLVKRQLAGIQGIIEVSSFGGQFKEYEAALDPNLLQAHGLTAADVVEAIQKNNQNSGGSYIEQRNSALYIRTEGRIGSLEELGEVAVHKDGKPAVPLRMLGTMRLGYAPRYGAMTMDGKGEVVGGITLMLKGANSSEAVAEVKKRIEAVRTTLPKGVDIYPYLDRSVLVGKTIQTVQKNLLEGGLIVVLVLVLFLGNFRAGLIVASVIPLSMLFAFMCMRFFGISANLMSLGAIDFGIVVDGAVIIVEGVLFALHGMPVARKLDAQEMNATVERATLSIYKASAFGVLIILLVFLPVLSLQGVEGKMFKPMALTVGFAIFGSLILSLTYIPMMSALFLSKNAGPEGHAGFADRMVGFLQGVYAVFLEKMLKKPAIVLLISLAMFAFSVLVFLRMGSEFIPTLEEGDLAMQVSVQPGSALSESIRTCSAAEALLKKNFPEVKHVVSKIGTAEVPTDPMAVEDADVMILLKNKDEWVSASTREELSLRMKEVLEKNIIGASFEFTQPIQLRFNELLSGSKADLAIQIFGEDVTKLKELADKAAVIIESIPGAGDVKVEQTEGLQQLLIRADRRKMAQWGVNADDVNALVRTAMAGETVGKVYEGERHFDLVVRLLPEYRQNADLNSLYLDGHGGRRVPLSEVVDIRREEGPMMISRDNARRRINIGVNVRGRDLASLVNEVDATLSEKLRLPPGYYLEYGGQYKNLQNAQRRLALAIPAALALIFLLLFMAFGTLRHALMVFAAVPMSAIGGIFALWLRDLPFSISGGIGFIALFGVAVLNGLVLIDYLNTLRSSSENSLAQTIIQGASDRLRPVLMTALVAALGFIPMAMATGSGGEVQRPLATVVIGGLVSSTLLTLAVMPVLYFLIEKIRFRK